jgi:hypothetical protein
MQARQGSSSKGILSCLACKGGRKKRQSVWMENTVKKCRININLGSNVHKGMG